MVNPKALKIGDKIILNDDYAGYVCIEGVVTPGEELIFDCEFKSSYIFRRENTIVTIFKGDLNCFDLVSKPIKTILNLP